jgi:uncharacterized protein
VSVCLDAYALLCWLQDEPGAEVVERYLAAGEEAAATRCPISLINLGEVFYRLRRTAGDDAAAGFWKDALRGVIPVRPVEVTRTRVREAAALKGRYPIAFADAFAIQLAVDQQLPLLTGDPEMKAIEGREALEIVWLPRKGR